MAPAAALVPDETRRRRFEDSLDEEVRFHLDAQTEDLVRTGVPPEDVARRARAWFGGIEAMKDECRRARGLRVPPGPVHRPPPPSKAEAEV